MCYPNPALEAGPSLTFSLNANSVVYARQSHPLAISSLQAEIDAREYVQLYRTPDRTRRSSHFNPTS
ncbi:hypothetical protein D9613_000051 [Agrocybe pediades]|uniref:Uncharacterized protein n=1 Tax=Agrocybe pediades TaxID=84607 RepID=A0A8H4VSJ8_9AGAR|nr:hypothetical protein D9613_000051 [Agrocybe pediades]